MPTSDPNITVMVETFAIQIAAAVEASMVERLQATLAGAFGAPQKREPGKPPKQTVEGVAPVAARSAGRRTRPKQFCPVPGCKNVAVPVFGWSVRTTRTWPSPRSRSTARNARARPPL